MDAISCDSPARTARHGRVAWRQGVVSRSGASQRPSAGRRMRQLARRWSVGRVRQDDMAAEVREAHDGRELQPTQGVALIARIMPCRRDGYFFASVFATLFLPASIVFLTEPTESVIRASECFGSVRWPPTSAFGCCWPDLDMIFLCREAS